MNTTVITFLAILLSITLGFAYWLFVTGVIGAIRMLQSKHWTHTIGNVIAVEVKFKQHPKLSCKTNTQEQTNLFTYSVLL